MTKLNVDWDQVARCREHAESVMHPVSRYIAMHSTIAVERAVLRLLGFDEAMTLENGYMVPMVNLIVEKMGRDPLRHGVAPVMASIRKSFPRLTQKNIGEKIIHGEIDCQKFEPLPSDRTTQILKAWIDSAYHRLDRMRYKKEEARYRGYQQTPLKCVMIATGNAEEDVILAKTVAKQGADVIAILRSTAQSLLDYVPHGQTSDGHGGTFATQENFRLLKEELDAVSAQSGRTVRISHNASGLCLPELAALAALEGLDYLVHDAISTTIYRDINIKRSMIDQHFSKIVMARAGITMHSGENYLLSQAVPEQDQDQTLAISFLNEQLAKAANVRDDLFGISYVFALDPKSDNSFLQEVAMAQLIREIFPRAPLKYYSSSVFNNGDGNFNQVLNTLFHMVGLMTGQRVQLIATPARDFLKTDAYERFVGLKSAASVFQSARSLYDEIQFTNNGKIMRRASTVLDLTVKLMNRIRHRGFFDAIEQGLFSDVTRNKDSGRGFDGVFAKSKFYYNPFIPKENGNGRH